MSSFREVEVLQVVQDVFQSGEDLVRVVAGITREEKGWNVAAEVIPAASSLKMPSSLVEAAGVRILNSGSSLFLCALDRGVVTSGTAQG